MTRTLQSIQTFFLDFCPGPSLHNTAAATSLTSFINVSGQPYSRKRWQKLFLMNRTCPADTAVLADFRVFLAKG
jgi:hypothetical protein